MSMSVILVPFTSTVPPGKCPIQKIGKSHPQPHLIQFPCCPSYFRDVLLLLKAYRIVINCEVTCEAWYIFGVMTAEEAHTL